MFGRRATIRLASSHLLLSLPCCLLHLLSLRILESHYFSLFTASSIQHFEGEHTTLRSHFAESLRINSNIASTIRFGNKVYQGSSLGPQRRSSGVAGAAFHLNSISVLVSIKGIECSTTNHCGNRAPRNRDIDTQNEDQ